MRQLEWIVMLFVASTLTACHDRTDPVEQAREDARAVAMVEAAQKIHPPPVSLAPQPWSSADLAAYRLPGSECRLHAFMPVADGASEKAAPPPRTDPILVGNTRRAMVKLDGRFLQFAADTGSAALVPGMVRHYVGKSHSLTLGRQAGDGTSLGAEALSWPATLTIRDAWDQLVFTVPGVLDCGP